MSESKMTRREAEHVLHEVACAAMARHLGWNLDKCIVMARKHIAETARHPIESAKGVQLYKDVIETLKIKLIRHQPLPIAETKNTRRVVHGGPKGPQSQARSAS